MMCSSFGPFELFKEFLHKMKNNGYNLSFTMSSSHESITFLDVKIQVMEGGMLQSALFRKSTAGNSILHYNSFHPTSLIKSIPVGQYLKLRRICSKEDSFRHLAAELQRRLIKCG